MHAPYIRLAYFFSSNILTYLPKRLELLFLTVFAFPNASNIGLHLKIFSSIGIESPKFWPLWSLREVKYYIENFAFSVFPAPDSPEITIAWFLLFANSCTYALAERA